jgi:ABC-type bacteriocin/lantibiotic exporter with double-glycine peptidase domain
MGAFGAAALRVMPSFNRIITSMLSLKNFSFTVDRMTPLKNQYILPYPIHPKMDFEDKMDIKNLSFSYPNTNAPTLRDINISVKKGEMVGIIGASGSGKTTLLNLVLQFLESDDGQIKVDNQVLNRDNSGSFQKILGYVKQDVFIKDAPMMENIAFDRHNIDKERVLRVIEEAHLSDFLAELPDGLNTMLGENGANLSGGQKQRIGIARALYQDAEILLFDEITSALDAETEQAITESISNLAKLNKTVIIVAHRISTLRYCDRIYELKDGEIIREVSYAELTV